MHPESHQVELSRRDLSGVFMTVGDPDTPVIVKNPVQSLLSPSV